MMKTKNGSYTFTHLPYEIFFNVGFWRWGSYHIGTTKVLQRGPIRIFVRSNK